MKIHKKQNGQLVGPFIPQVLAVLFWREPFFGHRAGPTIKARWAPPLFCAPTILAWISAVSPLQHSSSTASPSPLPQQTRHTSLLYPFPYHFLLSLPIEKFIFSASPPSRLLQSPHSHCNISLNPSFQEANPDRNGLGQLRIVTCFRINQPSKKPHPQPFLSRKVEESTYTPKWSEMWHLGPGTSGSGVCPWAWISYRLW